MQAQLQADVVSKRRSTRLTLSIAVTLSGVDIHGESFNEPAQTICVSRHGGAVATNREMAANAPITLEIRSFPRKARARVASVGKRRSPKDPFELGFELEEPGNFWGIEFPPADWREAAQRVTRGAPASEDPLNGAAPVSNAPPQETQFPPQPAPAASAPPPAEAPLPVPAASSPNPLDPNSAAQAALAALKEQMQLSTEAFAKLFQDELARMVHKTHEHMRQELNQMAGRLLQNSFAALRKQVQADLDQLGMQAREMLSAEVRQAREKATTESVNAIRRRLAAMLAVLDAPATDTD